MCEIAKFSGLAREALYKASHRYPLPREDHRRVIKHAVKSMIYSNILRVVQHMNPLYIRTVYEVNSASVGHIELSISSI
jgi:hypothetical protein